MQGKEPNIPPPRVTKPYITESRFDSTTRLGRTAPQNSHRSPGSIMCTNKAVTCPKVTIGFSTLLMLGMILSLAIINSMFGANKGLMT